MSKHTVRFYDWFSFLYPVVDLILRPQKNVLFNEINSMPEGTLLDIGVGNGSHLQRYQRHTITGIDTSSAMLKVAFKRKGENMKLVQMNGEALAFQPDSFDYVVLSHVITVVDHPERLLQEVFRVLKPNGKVFILNHFTPDGWLKYIDRSFGPVSKIFRFRSVFFINDLKTIEQFSLLKELPCGSLSYFKLLIYQKA